MKEIRCDGCNKLLGKGIWVELQVKCPRCKTMNNLKAASLMNGDTHDARRRTNHSLDGREAPPG